MIIGTYKKSSQNTLKGSLTDSENEDDGEIEVVGDSEAIGWAYIGSHNFTRKHISDAWWHALMEFLKEAAWGNLDGSSFNPVLTVGTFCFAHFPRFNVCRSQIWNLAFSYL